MPSKIAKTHRQGEMMDRIILSISSCEMICHFCARAIFSSRIVIGGIGRLSHVFPLHSVGEQSNQIVHQSLWDSLPLLLQRIPKRTDGDREWAGSYYS
ncbi:hypothetical protein AVEN_100689-1 [Araneus ventricosus]|uniref:Uncharacterized protein n=1 Tax=Araneus ventricosus TaxID=182803 RepID=A0A4Y2CUK4_ARAVE|nr:hypothetical protein AVEN_100689-1 [Araneus ventricosus]